MEERGGDSHGKTPGCGKSMYKGPKARETQPVEGALKKSCGWSRTWGAEAGGWLPRLGHTGFFL